jgi:hypothetical protein
MSTIIDTINKIYQKNTYLERYGGSLVFSIFAVLCVALYFTYMHIENNAAAIRNHWPKHKCNPLYMPFAGLIMNPTNMSTLDFSIQNFSDCSQIIMKDIMQVVLAPIEASSILIGASISILTGVMSSFMGAISNLRELFGSGLGKTGEKQSNVVTSVLKLTNIVKNFLGKGEGVLATTTYIFFSVYAIFSSFFYILLIGAVLILIIMYVVLYALWSLFLALLFFFITTPIAWSMFYIPAALTIIYVAFMIMVLVVVVFTASVIAKTN